MDSYFESRLDKYAEVIVKMGLNIQPGQRLLIGMPFYTTLGTPIELAPIVRRIASHAYQVGARHVEVLWNDEQLELIRYQEAPEDSFEEFPRWRIEAALDLAQAGDAILILLGGITDLLEDQNPERISRFFNKTLEIMKPVIDLRVKNSMPFTVAFAPVKGWADKIFPHIDSEKRISQAWETIFKLCRMNDPDPVASWKAHINELRTRSEYLNEKQYTALHLTAPGTDLTVGLPEGHVWRSANLTSLNGIDFTANIPTEEIFTLPHKDRIQGMVRSTKPVPAKNELMEDIELTFSNGKVIKATAKKGEEVLKRYLETDGMLSLGEIALVPHSSPISQSGLLFNSILIDENASNHIALGRAYNFCLAGGEQMSDEEFEAAGGNISLDHLDLMIGSGEMDVFGITSNGSAEPVMKAGEWVFEV